MIPDKVKPLYEYMEFKRDDDLLTEADFERMDKDGKLIMAGILQRADAENGNGRVYPRRLLERELKNYQKLIKERRALGELDHPDSSVVELKNASHLVTKVWWKGNDVYGKVEVLSTPSGQILKDLVNDDITLGISSRGLGSTREEGGKTLVEDDFQLICFDFVSDPSTQGAFMMKEGKDYLINRNQKVFDKSYRINRLLNDILDPYQK